MGSSPGLPPQLSAASCFPNVPLGFAEQSLGRRTTVRTRKPGDLPEQRHPSAARGARVGRASAVVTERIVTRWAAVMGLLLQKLQKRPDWSPGVSAFAAACGACAAFLCWGEGAAAAKTPDAVVPVESDARGPARMQLARRVGARGRRAVDKLVRRSAAPFKSGGDCAAPDPTCRKTTQCRQSTRSALTDSARPFSIESVQVRRLV